jgi:MFS transporter, OFA family, oxalate/formate antiporter
MNSSEKQPSEFARGWRVLVAAAIGTACGASAIPINTLGGVIQPIEAEFGWGRGDIQLAFLWFTFAGALTFPIGAYLMDRFGARPVALIATFLFGVTWATIAYTPESLTGFYMLWALMGIVSAGSTPVTWTRTVNSWFVKRRGIALAITLSVSASVGALSIFVSPWLISTYGWRSVFYAYAALPLFLAVPIALMWFHEPPPEVAKTTGAGKGKLAPGLTIAQSFANYRLWLILVAIVCVTLGVMGIVSNIRPLLEDEGFTAQTAANVAGTIALSVLFGRLLTGWLIDRFWAPGVVFPMLLLPSIACIILAQADISIPVAFLAAVLVGLAAGAESDVMAYLTVKYFGMRQYSLLFGLKFGVFAVTAGVSPALFGTVFDRFGTYAPILYISAGLFVIAAFLMIALGKYPVLPSAEPDAKAEPAALPSQAAA